MDRNRRQFWQLTEPEHLQARAFCRKLMGNRDDGDDLYQDVLVTACAGFAGLRDIRAFRGWLYRIIVNSFRNRKRQPWYRRFRPLTDQVAENLVGDNPVASRMAQRKLEIAFRAVSAEDRALVTLFEIEGWTISEIAVMQERSVGAVKMRLSRARKKMRAALVRHHQRADGAKEKSKSSEEKLCVATKLGTD